MLTIDSIGQNDATSLQRFFKQQSPGVRQGPASLASLLPRTPKDITLTPIPTEGTSVMEASECGPDDGGGMEDDKMLFAGLSVSDLTSVENVEDGINGSSMSTLFSEQKIDAETPNVSSRCFFLSYELGVYFLLFFKATFFKISKLYISKLQKGHVEASVKWRKPNTTLMSIDSSDGGTSKASNLSHDAMIVSHKNTSQSARNKKNVSTLKTSTNEDVMQSSITIAKSNNRRNTLFSCSFVGCQFSSVYSKDLTRHIRKHTGILHDDYSYRCIEINIYII